MPSSLLYFASDCCGKHHTQKQVQEERVHLTIYREGKSGQELRLEPGGMNGNTGCGGALLVGLLSRLMVSYLSYLPRVTWPTERWSLPYQSLIMKVPSPDMPTG